MQPESRRARILVVDDERDTLELTEAMLTARGYDVVLVESGPAALEALACRPDVVLLDVMMPEMSGLSVLEHMRRTPRLAAVPVILFTARQRDADVLEGYRTGADYYITKPCTIDQIVYGLDLVLSVPGRRVNCRDQPAIVDSDASRGEE